MKQSLTVVIPAYNESQRIINNLENIDSFIVKNNSFSDFQIIIVNDGSTDNTEKVVSDWINNNAQKKKCYEIISYSENQGKGFAVKKGFERAKCDLVLYTDADGASPLEEIKKLLELAEKGYDVICGSRVLREEGSSVKITTKRRIVGFIFHFILSLLGLAFLLDTQCGFKLFKLEVAKKLAKNQKCFNFSFDVEYLYMARLFGYKIKEVSINWQHVKGSKVSLLWDPIKMFVEIFKIRFIYKYNG